MFKILKKERLNSVVVKMEVEAPYIARRCEPGQFVMVRVEVGGERIPLTIADFDRSKQCIVIIYQELGFSTKRLSTKNAGDYLQDVAGPLGIPAELGNPSRVLGIGGGVGAAPLFPQLKKLAGEGSEVDVILGARTHELVLLEKEFKQFAREVFPATDDGSYGFQGTVVDAMLHLFNSKTYDKVIAIGPLPMMKAVVEKTKPLGIPTGVSLNPIMIDGTGMCGGCRVTIGGETKFACVDGPDFDGFAVDFDECIRRQRMYKKQEQIYEEKHRCLIGLGE